MTTDAFPFKEIRKRDGRVVPFDAEKITQAIFKAAKAVGGEDYALAGELTREVVVFLDQQRLPGLIPAVEEIQDAVEKILIETGHARTAKAYILYRARRTRIREAKSELMDAVKEILMEGNRSAGESNLSPAEKMHQIALAASQKYYLDNLLPPEIANAHQRGSFYIHNLGYYSKALDSIQIDLQPLFNGGRCAAQFFPRDLPAAFLRVAAFLQRSRGDLYGEQALPFFDRYVGELIRNFDHQPAGGELAGHKPAGRGFTNHQPAERELVNHKLAGGELANHRPAGGELANNKPAGRALARTLGEFLTCLETLSAPVAGNALRCSLQLGLDTTGEGRQVAKSLLEGIGKRQQPKIIFLLKQGVNLQTGDPNYDLYQIALASARRGGNPAFAFLDTANNNSQGQDVCYFSNGGRIAENKCGLAGGVKRGNIAAITLNLPRLALFAAQQELFFVELDRLLRLGVRQLLHRYEVLTSLQCRDLPFLMGAGLYQGSEKLAAGESIKESLKNGLLTIGFTGLPEAAGFLTGHKQAVQGEKESSYTLALKIVEHMSRRVQSFADEYDLNIALGGVLNCGKLPDLVAKDRRDFGFVKGVTDKGSYSSCFVLFPEDEGLQSKIILEGEIHKNCAAGYASRVILLPEMDVETVEEMFLKFAAAGIGFLRLAVLGIS